MVAAAGVGAKANHAVAGRTGAAQTGRNVGQVSPALPWHLNEEAVMWQTRRMWLRRTAALVGVAGLGAGIGRAVGRERRRQFTMDLTPGAIGVGLPLPEVIALAGTHGFESVAPDVGYLAGLAAGDVPRVLDQLKGQKLVWGAAGLPVEFRGDDATFRKGMEALPAQAKALEAAGVTRVGTWIRPTHAELTFEANLEQHARRLREVAGILNAHGLRLGLEYVGPKTSWTAAKYPFVHNLAGMKQLIAAIDQPNVGLVLDSWHWYTAGETAEDLRTLTGSQVVACDLNDAPAGIAVDAQQDLKRELPCATGVIDVKTFLETLIAIGYDGPVRAEPFKAELRSLPPAEAVARTAAAMKQAFALVGG
jgi:sugar phosphate isomerase/epimerase